ncbi:MAG: GNAT family N-acetyltransferase [Firmicutes bacterium]|jgi:GNAT superfamily N-acetyltransferase|nr:GNAT family N-acetyltransferase [Bacillota bacterium]
MINYQIAGMEPRDRSAIRKICCDTGYVGQDIRPYIDDEELFADFWTLYYTDFEPQSTFVARVGDLTIGYLNGCLNTQRYNRTLAVRIIPRLLFGAARKQYHIGKKTKKYIRDMFSGISAGNPYPPLGLYPAHLHINIDRDYRRKGIGEALMNRFFTHLQAHGIKGVHLGTTSLNRSAVPFYEKMGFKLYSRVKNDSFEGQKAFSLTYVKSFH